MQLSITLIQHGKKQKKITTTLDERSFTFQMTRKLLEIEQFLNSLPGANLRVHVHITDDVDGVDTED